eukprot:CAMPEP_0119337388 /NCGR_PEP_ID=MMETSP1333-20130426/93903_1 /TAXON_ID=418940 /ORGANISM="Scyphosphaera apsteinii, Strain RCC1455" /LENGTH=53 /DNA_ID=CAMNT_0007348415 /DNA_START=426 /DNA_END=587 /DNA_ORIENTATION=+
MLPMQLLSMSRYSAGAWESSKTLQYKHAGSTTQCLYLPVLVLALAKERCYLFA